MRMSVSRLAALGAALLAGATLAACTSSGTPIAPTGNNNQVTSFPGAPLMFIQGSPNLHLGITTADFRVDGQLVVTLGYGQSTPFILSIPAGSHTVTLYDHANPTSPLFTGRIVTLSPNTKYAIVAGGDAGAATAQIFLFVVPHYNTNNIGSAMSFFNASPRAGTTSLFGRPLGTVPLPPSFSSTASVGGTGASNATLPASTSFQYCFAAYDPALMPGTSIPGGTDPKNVACSSTFGVPVNSNFFLIDSGIAAQSFLFLLSDQNG
jgi:hypothetical protein